jgi:protein ImuA
MTGHQRPAVIEQLRARIATIERMGVGGEDEVRPVLTFGQPAIDMALPWLGLPLGCLHEIVGQGTSGFAAASGFTCALLDRLGGGECDIGDMAVTGVTVLWCLQAHEVREHGVPYAPGFAALGLDPAHTIVTRGRNDTDILWAMEEGLHTPEIGVVIGETNAVDFTYSRRLQLAAEASGVTAFILRRGVDMPASAAVTRWRVVPVSGISAGGVRWQLVLQRCRGGTPNEWFVEWNDETGNFAVAPEFRHGMPQPHRAYA